MTRIVDVVLILLLGAVPVQAGKRADCRRACGGRIAACQGLIADFGTLAKGCTKAVLRQCMRAGIGSCEVASTTTSTSTTTTTLSSCAADLAACTGMLATCQGDLDTCCVPGCTVMTCSCTSSDYTWSSSTHEPNPNYAWYVYFVTGCLEGENKAYTKPVRAVRGGA